jgi:hypothetical protein
MLSPEERIKLDEIIKTVKEDLIHGTTEDLKTQLEKIEWLSFRLKKSNDALVGLTIYKGRTDHIHMDPVFKNPKRIQ